MDQPGALAQRRSSNRPRRSSALILAARVADVWLHPIAFLRGHRRRPMTFDDLRAIGLLEPHRPVARETMGDESVSGVQETRVPVVH
jgi:hypothetical protein